MAIKSSVASYFQQLLSAELVFPEEMDMECLEDGLTDEDRRFLCDMPTLEEVREAFFSIEPESVAGSDGFGAIFYHTYWDFVSQDVFGIVTEFFWGVEMPTSFTATTISLIPKTDSPAFWSEYRLISLCNVTNKICTKLMTIRLGRVLPKVLSLSQSGFVPRRLLSDNVFLAQELIHSLESRRLETNVIFKLDMAKAYDHVSWEFLYQFLRQKGFLQCWIDLVANVVSNCWFSILVNGSMLGFFHSTQGLRQGDPLSPALFVLTADYLSRGLHRLFAAHPLMYYQTPSRVRVSHLTYADDMMIFTNICIQNMELIRNFIRAYERVSRQMINSEKSSFIVGRQVPSLQTQLVQNVMGYRLKYLPVTYLGVPLYKGNRNTCLFDPIISRLRIPYNGIIPPFGTVCVEFEMWRSRSSFGLWVMGQFPSGMIIGLIAAGQEDKIVWTRSNDWVFSTGAAWETIRVASPQRQILADIWHHSLADDISILVATIPGSNSGGCTNEAEGV
ncbi:UNVERIFIED_CONTAM: hypothetical protein Slati_0420100 [Sesamum latifolium]|uniref:Reverse transcriptase domain-containing protein n=1 Tax=Sesamum latifolium TaxID=2727402 RepID=A0AAW2XVC7_9LAMI